MAGVTHSVNPASERDRLESRRASENLGAPLIAGDQERSQSSSRASGPRLKVSTDSTYNFGKEIVAVREANNRQDQSTTRLDQHQNDLYLRKDRTSPQAEQDQASPVTGDNNKNNSRKTALVDKITRGSLIGGLIRSRQEKPVNVAPAGAHKYIRTTTTTGTTNGKRQVIASSDTQVNRRDLKSILKEHQTGTLADKTQRRTSYSAGGKQQESEERNQQHSSVDDNQSGTGNNSSRSGELGRQSSDQQHKTKEETEGQNKSLISDTSNNKKFFPENDDQNDESDWTTVAKGKRPPTFGTTPYKLSRLPYYSYYGKARNVELVDRGSREERQNHHQQINRIAGSGESSGRSSASLSENSLSSLTSQARRSSGRGISQPRSREQEREQRSDTPFRESSSGRRGYSNISNLFPGAPVQVSKSNTRASSQHRNQVDERLMNKKHSSSLLSLTQDKKSSKDRSAPDYLERRMRRQNSSLSGRPLSTRYNGAQNQHRSTSAFGGQPLSQYHRSPSAISLMYGGSTGVSPVYGGQGPIDPDCPVHGYSPLGANMSKSTQQLNTIGAGFGLPDPNLLYDAQPTGLYNDRVARNLYPTSSPSQPLLAGHLGATLTKRQPSSITTTTAAGAYLHGPPPGEAYYNGPNRFSLYHSMGNEFGTRSSLAPPNEQLRRILGYQPQPRPIHLHPQWAYSRPFIHLQESGWRSPSPSGPLDPVTGQPQIKPVFLPYNQLQDTQAVRAVDFHPSGEVYAIGSNSRTLRICAYPADYELRHFDRDRPSSSSRVLFKFLQVHRGSIYCVQFNATGQLLATGSNDQTVHIARYNSTTHCPDGDEFRLTMHDGTVRDLCFIDDSTNGSALLLSAGGGDNKIYVTDCDTITPFQSMTGHTQTVMSLHHWGGANFVSASLDKSIRFWDLRTRSCTSIVSALPLAASPGTNHKWAGPGAPVCAVKVDPSGRLMASGHSDSTCMLYDIRGARIIQSYKPHDDEVRTLSFSPKSYYLLSGGYDGRIMLTDLQGDLTQPLPTCCVAECDDKIVQAKWHPSDYTFVTTSADKTATLWALPTE